MVDAKEKPKAFFLFFFMEKKRRISLEELVQVTLKNCHVQDSSFLK